jgi:hypothetical protein
MDRVEFEKKYVDLLDSQHLQLVSDEFKEDLKTMLITEIGRAILSMTNSENSKMNRLEEYD